MSGDGVVRKDQRMAAHLLCSWKERLTRFVNELRRASSCFSDEGETRVISELILWVLGGAMQEPADFQDINPMQTRNQCGNHQTQAPNRPFP